MSRRQDETISLSEANANYVAYEDISRALSSYPDTILEIELLGKSHLLPQGTSLLQDGHCIAVPKSKLLQAFIVARKIFFTIRQNGRLDEEQNLRHATAVILLLDSEHQTAANSRKRLIQLQMREDRGKSRAILEAELCWVNGYLTSHLHRHTKSPVLWGHRRWLVEQTMSLGQKPNILQDLKMVVFKAAERHPRNYYAWSHLRWLLDHQLDSGNSENRWSKFFPDFQEITTIVQDWCLNHPWDTSGFSFLLFFLTRSESKQLMISVFSAILKVTIAYNWAYESVWMFLRTMATLDEVDFGVERTISAIQEITLAQPDTVNSLQNVQKWLSKQNR
ncbi:BgTH12-06436 [Blumeria graminis f. sp. triticale]|uniref:Protein prenyltransferase n=4 Tax=Blumeria graminis TaxID=34373 RepID=A0A656KG01_BLUGR|nr:hypothetical protein BGT96224_2869 [Blumeria graminis f. sp. tritici 96224]CAD6500729.1 BgTH12-06436 [Blumeria graminis f. sp. triticale]VCU41007.1 Bgt-2869 [Blumeria graminis f. sp. tritici]